MLIFGCIRIARFRMLMKVAIRLCLELVHLSCIILRILYVINLLKNLLFANHFKSKQQTIIQVITPSSSSLYLSTSMKIFIKNTTSVSLNVRTQSVILSFFGSSIKTVKIMIFLK